MIIGIVGSIASGKDTVADYLKTKGFESFSHSDALREIMRKEGIETTTQNMTDFGNNLRKTKGYGYLSELIVNQLNPDKNTIVTSIRQVGEIEYYRTHCSDFVLIKLDAPINLRFERVIKRNRPGDIQSMNELKDIEAKQADGNKGAINMNKCYEMADIVIENDGTFEELYKKVDQIVKEQK